MTKLDKVATSYKFSFFGVFFVIVPNRITENATKRYHGHKVTAVLHIYSKILGIRLPGNKNKTLMLIKV